MEKQSWRYSMQDGLAEILLGILLIVAGVLLSRDLPFGFVPLLFIIVIAFLYEKIRKRFTYPRIGRVKLHEDEPKRTAGGIFLYMFIVAVCMAVAMFVIFREITSHLIYRSLPIFFALMLLGAMTYSHGKSGSKRYYVYAAIALVSAPLFSLIDFGSKLAGLGYYLLFIGSLFTVIGLVIFVRFLRKYPPLE